MNKKLQNSLEKYNKVKEDAVVPISGTLGIPLSGRKLVEVPNRSGFVYVKLKDNTSEVIQAYNSTVSNTYDLPVLVVRQNNIYTVMGRNLDLYRNWGNVPYLPKHGGQHSFNPELSMGADITWIYSQQIMPLLGYPSGTDGSPRLSIAPYIIRDLSGNWKYVGNTGTISTTPYNPTTGSRAVMGLVYLDTVSGNPFLLINSGTYISESLTGTNQIASYIPQLTNPNHLPITAFRLLSGTSSLTWNNLYDVRPFLQVIPTGSSGFVVQDEGIFKGLATTLNVIGPNADISISGSVARLFITGSTGGSVNPPVTGTIVLLDDWAIRGSIPLLNFGLGLSANLSGTYGDVNVDFGTGTFQSLRGSTTPYDIGAIPNDGWIANSNTWTFYNRTQAYTNDPAAGVSIVLNMASTTDFIVGSDVTVSSSAGSENTYVTAVVANTSITVNQLTLDHTTSSPLVRLLDVFTVNADVSATIKAGISVKYTQTTVKYGTVYSSTNSGGTTTIVLIHNTDYGVTNAAISATYYSPLASPSGWPGWFNFDPAPLGWSVIPTTGATYRYYPLGKTMYVSIAQTNDAGTSNATTMTFSAPIITQSLAGAINVTTLDNGVLLTTPGRLTPGNVNTSRTLTSRSNVANGAWTAALGKRIVTLLFVEY